MTFRCPACRAATWPIQESPGSCPGCETPLEWVRGILVAAPASSEQERRQREIYEARKKEYRPEPPPDPDGFESLLLTYREHIRMLDRLEPRADHEVLDVGCSSGRFLNLMTARYGCRGAGLDLSLEALLSAAATNPHGHRFALSTAERPLPFGDESFDRVVCFDVLEHLERPGAAIAEIRRVLRPNGRALFHVPVSDFGGTMDWVYSKFRPRRWAEGMRAAGHDYRVILTREGYEREVEGSGLRITDSRRFNSMLQNVFDYHLVHRILNRLFYVHHVPFRYYHRLVAPLIESLTSPDRLLQAADIGASVYILASK